MLPYLFYDRMKRLNDTPVFRGSLLSLLLLCCLVSNSFSQSLPNDNIGQQPTSSSPNAAHASYGESISVNPFTGKLDMSFSIFSYANQSTGLSHGINLFYQGGGIRVDDIASNIGLGFSLSLGGAITRQINGLPDEATLGFNYVPHAPIPADDTENLNAIVDNRKDEQYDEYYYSAGPASGKFVIGKNKQIVAIPQTNVKIEMIGNTSPVYAQNLDSCRKINFRITLEDGTKYYYNNYDCSCIDTSGAYRKYASSTWYLSKIVSAFDQDSILFQYTPHIQEYFAGKSASRYTRPFDPNENPVTLTRTFTNSYNMRRLDMQLNEITYPNGTKVTLHYDNFMRHDLKTDAALKEIVLSNPFSAVQKGFRFRYSYFNRGIGSVYAPVIFPYQDYSVHPNPTDIGSFPDWTSSLKLDGFYMFSGNDSLPGYTFNCPYTYLPRRGAETADQWGYYGSRSRFPDIADPNYRFVASGNAIPSLNGTLEASVNEVITPLGGKISFDYELNTIKNSGNPADSIFLVGSLYLQNNYDAYVLDDTFSSGWPIIAPSASFPTNRVLHRLTITPSGDWPTNFGTTQKMLLAGGYRIWGGGDWIQALNTASFNYTEFTNRTPKVIEFYGAKKDTMTYQALFAPNNIFPQMADKAFTVKWEMLTTNPGGISGKVGGLRVKRMIQSDRTGHSNNMVKEYRYLDENGISSSGIKVNDPVKSFKYTEIYEPAPGNPNHPQQPVGIPLNLNYSYDMVSNYVNPGTPSGTSTLFMVATTDPLNNFLSMNGNPAGYSRVEEYLGTADNYKQKTVYTFTTDCNWIPDSLKGNTFPFAMRPDLDFSLGLPISKTIYNAAGKKLSSSTTEYTSYYQFLNNDHFISTKVGLRAHSNLHPAYSTCYYYPITGKVLPVKTTETQYYEGGDSIVNVVQTSYDTAKMLPKLVQSTNSAGELIQTRYYYPYNFNVGGAITTLNNKGIIYAPIRLETWKGNSPNNNGRVVNASVSTFTELNNGTVKQDASYGLTTQEPIPLFNWDGYSSTQLMPNPQSFTKLAQMDQYDDFGNLVQATAKGVTSSTIWDYYHAIAVAQVTNAKQYDIAYTSFEADGTGGWDIDNSNGIDTLTPAITGRRYAALSSAGLTKNSLDINKTYVVSAWVTVSSPPPVFKKNSNTVLNAVASDTHKGWMLYKAEFDNATSISVSAPTGRTLVDEVRLYPLGAAMTTYTHDPLLGITSVCDASNRIMYNEYDLFGRLHIQRNMDGHILKVYEYKVAETQN